MKVFIIGFGRMGYTHYLVVSKVLPNAEIEVFDAQTRPRDYAREIVINDVKALEASLNEYKPDLVIISTTSTARFSYLQMCFHANIKYVLCEKPVCVSLREAELLEVAVKEFPEVNLAINHQMRFMEQYTIIKEKIKFQEFGPLGSISVQAGNFGAAMNGTHYFEMFRFISDCDIHKVWAWLRPQTDINPRGAQFQDVSGSVRLENKKGQRFYMDISEDQGHGIFVTYTCKYAQIHVDELLGRVYVSKRKNKEDMNLPTTRYGLPSEVNSLTIEPADALIPTERILKSLLSGKNFPTLYDGIMAVKTLVAAYASSDLSGKEILLDNIPCGYKEKVFAWA
jgi:predicted dehydrogenase